MSPCRDVENADVFQQDLIDGLTARRQSLGLTQGEVAERVGTTRVTVSRMESGSGDPQLSTIVKLATALNMRVSLVDSSATAVVPLPADLVHRGLSFNRTQHRLDQKDRQRERAFATAWESVNKVEPVGLAPLIPHLIPDCSQAQATACATLVQWLGSEVGFDFLTRALESVGYSLTEARTKAKS